ncbi:MAG TPA: DNA-3-methyladenine glycosylase [Flavobacteriales bacterium]|nr:DNA-3-methyladenine glycosylase [Flavobacteriales bacterium]HIO67626.1 DNA-3-methyladenine glycosylase [Flavobacteriales bacterium]
MEKLKEGFYQRADVVQISKELLGKYLMTHVDGQTTGGIITETEAYAGIRDQASHAYGNRRTSRTEIMYNKGGAAYVYLCYGIHHLFNVVTNKEGTPHAVLIRAIKPQDGMEIILKRIGSDRKSKTAVANGPGTVSKALGIHTRDSGIILSGDRIWVEDRGMVVEPSTIITGPRIGVDYAGEDAKLPYRFRIRI